MLIMGIFLPRVYYVWQWQESIGLFRVEAKNQGSSRRSGKESSKGAWVVVAEAQSTFSLPYVHFVIHSEVVRKKAKLVVWLDGHQAFFPASLTSALWRKKSCPYHDSITIEQHTLCTTFMVIDALSYSSRLSISKAHTFSFYCSVSYSLLYVVLQSLLHAVVVVALWPPTASTSLEGG